MPFPDFFGEKDPGKIWVSCAIKPWENFHRCNSYFGEKNLDFEMSLEGKTWYMDMQIHLSFENRFNYYESGVLFFEIGKIQEYLALGKDPLEGPMVDTAKGLHIHPKATL